MCCRRVGGPGRERCAAIGHHTVANPLLTAPLSAGFFFPQVAWRTPLSLPLELSGLGCRLWLVRESQSCCIACVRCLPDPLTLLSPKQGKNRRRLSCMQTTRLHGAHSVGCPRCSTWTSQRCEGQRGMHTVGPYADPGRPEPLSPPLLLLHEPGAPAGPRLQPPSGACGVDLHAALPHWLGPVPRHCQQAAGDSAEAQPGQVRLCEHRACGYW